MSRVIRDYRTVIELVARGRLVERLDEQIRDVLEALEASDDEKAKASLTVTLSFQRMADRTDVHGACKVVLPPDLPLPSLTLFNVEGGLSLQHPSQLDMFAGPRDAGAAASKVKGDTP